MEAVKFTRKGEFIEGDRLHRDEAQTREAGKQVTECEQAGLIG